MTNELTPNNPQTVADISEHQGNVDYALLVTRVRGVIHRATIGTVKDDTFEVNRAGLLPYGKPVGAYHYFISWLSGVDQAENYLDSIEDWEPQVWNGQEWVPGFVLDCEHNQGYSKTVLANRIRDFIEHVKSERPELTCVIYTRGYWWNDNIGTVLQDYFHQFLLWVARYSTTANHPWDDDLDSPLRPIPWVDWVLWQYSADGNNLGEYYGVESDDIDLNRTQSVTPPVPPPSDPCQQQAVVQGNAGGTNLRYGPSTAGTLIGFLENGTPLVVYASLNGLNGYDWYVVRELVHGRVGVVVQFNVQLEG